MSMFQNGFGGARMRVADKLARMSDTGMDTGMGGIGGAVSPRPRANGQSWGWAGGGQRGGGRVPVQQMGFGDAFGSFMNEMSGGQGVKGAVYGPAAADMIKGYQPGQVRAVAPKGWNSPFSLKGKGKK